MIADSIMFIIGVKEYTVKHWRTILFVAFAIIIIGAAGHSDAASADVTVTDPATTTVPGTTTTPADPCIDSAGVSHCPSPPSAPIVPNTAPTVTAVQVTPTVVPCVIPTTATINHGDLFTNSAQIIVTVVGCSDPVLAYDGGFNPAVNGLLGDNLFKLQTTGQNERLPKTVYVRVGSTVVTDDIILDTIPPTITPLAAPAVAAASVGKIYHYGKLRVRVDDNASGVGKVMFSKTKKYYVVKATDKAGNARTKRYHR